MSGWRRPAWGTPASGGHASPWAGFAPGRVRPVMRRLMYDQELLSFYEIVTLHVHTRKTQSSVYLERDLWRRRGRGDRERVRWRGRSRRASFSRSLSLSLCFGLSSVFAGFSGETSLGTSDTESGLASFAKSLDRKKKCCEASDHINYSKFKSPVEEVTAAGDAFLHSYLVEEASWISGSGLELSDWSGSG